VLPPGVASVEGSQCQIPVPKVDEPRLVAQRSPPSDFIMRPGAMQGGWLE